MKGLRRLKKHVGSAYGSRDGPLGMTHPSLSSYACEHGLAVHPFLKIQAHLRDVAGLVPDHHDGASVATEPVVIFVLVEGLVFSLQKNMTPVKHNKERCDKMRYAYTFSPYLMLVYFVFAFQLRFTFKIILY